ncbi:unnamed protein product [Mytilus coruscus]|uniref:Uncharacterized protein n=1 Tax=Mytilus coruscus TaxID=42192 RepID=A0A6J8BK77_MYTCO|nr:unnamed protein product [Mytilus coruscus]
MDSTRSFLTDIPVLALTATATEGIISDILKYLLLPVDTKIVADRTYNTAFTIFSYLMEEVGMDAYDGDVNVHNRIIELYTSSTDDETQSRIIDQFKKCDGKLRFLYPLLILMVLPSVLKKRHSLKGTKLIPAIKKIEKGQQEALKEFARMQKDLKTEEMYRKWGTQFLNVEIDLPNMSYPIPVTSEERDKFEDINNQTKSQVCKLGDQTHNNNKGRTDRDIAALGTRTITQILWIKAGRGETESYGLQETKTRDFFKISNRR